MDPIRLCSKRLFALIFAGMLTVFVAVAVAAYMGLNVISEAVLVMLSKADPAVPQAQDIAGYLAGIGDFFKTMAAPAAGGVFLIMSILVWLFARRLVSNTITSIGQRPSRKPRAEAPISPEIQKEKENQDRRLFIHLMAVLQREGRLMDFFSENLELYEDAQIGAAVRNIQENCKKVVTKYLEPQTVLSENEGDTITIPKDFDPNAIRLTGNVTGEPPFNGVVRHRGWKARKLDLPILSGSQEPGVIAPAEVEIL